MITIAHPFLLPFLFLRDPRTLPRGKGPARKYRPLTTPSVPTMDSVRGSWFPWASRMLRFMSCERDDWGGGWGERHDFRIW